MSQDHMILKLLIGFEVRFEGYMLIGTLLWWDEGKFNDDGMGFPLVGFEVDLSSDDLQVVEIASLWMIPI
jgi:hypothetical protein